ncbi:MAG: hypothetical protein ACXU86_08785, partial [Archangium sp.]
MRRTPESEPEPFESKAVPFQGVWNRRTVWVFCAVILGFCWVDTLYLGHLSVWAVGFRCAWALNMVGYTYLLERVPGSWVRPLTDLHILITSVSVLGITFEMGGAGSAYFIMVSSLPLTSALVYHWHRRAVLLSGVTGLAGTVLLVLTQGHRLIVAFTWVSMMMGTLVLAMHYSRQVLKVKEAEHQARLERTRREALEALTLSEHRRAQSEKLAIVGRLA